jgi:hypothetical protein
MYLFNIGLSAFLNGYIFGYPDIKNENLYPLTLPKKRILNCNKYILITKNPYPQDRIRENL